MALPEIDQKQRERVRARFRREAARIARRAKERGVENNFFFVNTMRTYQTQIALLDELEDAIRETGTTITKEYVKGRENICINPAITEYNKTASACNNTTATLLRILEAAPPDEQDNGQSKLAKLAASLEK